MSRSRQIPWFRVFVEGVVIVGSILLAFGIDAFWDEWQGRRQERALLRGLADEFENNRGSLDYLIALHERIDSAAIGILDLIADASDGQLVLVPDSMLAMVAVGGTYQPPQGVLQSAISSGDLSLIRGRDVQVALSEWPREVEEAVEEEERELEFVNATLVPFLAGSADLRASQITLAEWVAADRRRFAFPDAKTALRVNRELKNLMARRVFFARDATRSLRRLRQRHAETASLVVNRMR